MVATLARFSLAEAPTGAAAAHRELAFDAVGLVLINASNFLEALKSVLNERALISGATPAEIALHGNLVALAVIAPSVLLSGELWDALGYVARHPGVPLFQVLMFACGHAGSQATLVLTQVRLLKTSFCAPAALISICATSASLGFVVVVPLTPFVD
jgi:hypothetical protein